MSPHSTRRLARQVDTGLAHHRVLDVDELVTSAGGDQAATEPAPARPAYDWEPSNERKKDAVLHSPLADALDDIEARIAELITRTKDLDYR